MQNNDPVREQHGREALLLHFTCLQLVKIVAGSFPRVLDEVYLC